MKISFILLAHESPDKLEQLIVCLLESGSNVYVHYDAKSKHSLEKASRNWGLEKFGGQLYFAKRVSVHWGRWSVVRGALNSLYKWREVGDDSDYLMLISGSCLPIKPLCLLSEYLANAPVDHIETQSASVTKWVSHGSQEERWTHYNFISWRTYPRLYKLIHKLQENLRIRRKIPNGYAPYIGSQWWCLRTETVSKLLDTIDAQPELEKFYRYTSVPDEIFFRTLVANMVPGDQLSSSPLTMCSFNSRGVAEYHYDDGFGRLVASGSFFARKISPHAAKLKAKLRPIFAMSSADYQDYLARELEETERPCVNEASLLLGASRNAWHAFATSPEEPEEYCASIPNKIVVICGGTWERRRELASRLSNSEDISAYGHLFNKDHIDFGDKTASVGGYNRDHQSLAQHRWPFFLGDICKENDGKTVVFCLGDDADEYLRVLKHKVGLAVLLLEDLVSESADQGGDILAARKTFYGRVRLESALFERCCTLHRLTEENDVPSVLAMIENLGC